MRTASCRLIAEVKCIEAKRFSIHLFEPDLLVICLDNELLKPKEYQKLIREDGFENMQEFYNFFLSAERNRFDGWFFRWESIAK